MSGEIVDPHEFTIFSYHLQLATLKDKQKFSIVFISFLLVFS